MTGPSLHPCESFVRRMDMSRPLTIFGALVIATFAVCGTLDSRVPSGIVSDDPKVLNQENVAGPIDVELLADCSNNKTNAFLRARRCRETSQR